MRSATRHMAPIWIEYAFNSFSAILNCCKQFFWRQVEENLSWSLFRLNLKRGGQPQKAKLTHPTFPPKSKERPTCLRTDLSMSTLPSFNVNRFEGKQTTTIFQWQKFNPNLLCGLRSAIEGRGCSSCRKTAHFRFFFTSEKCQSVWPT